MVAFNVESNIAFENFDALVAGVNDWMDREDLTGVAPQMIALLEDELIARLSPFFQERTETLVAVGGVASLPADMDYIVRVSFGTGPSERMLPQNTSSMGFEVPQYGEPASYSVEGEMLRLFPAMDANISVIYQASLPRLTATAPTNALFAKFPSIYFFGAMMFANGYVADDERAARFRSLFDNMMDRAGKYLSRQRHAGPLVPRRVGLR